MSNVKYQALIDSGIKVINRHEIPDHLIHHVELKSMLKYLQGILPK